MERRQFTLLVSASVLPSAGCSALDGLGSGPYERSDLNLAMGLQCTAAERNTVVVTLSWEWADGAGGSAPADLLVIEWPDERWTLVEPVERTTETVRFDGKGMVDGMEGVRFEHEDAAADAGTTYAASCTLSPRGGYGRDPRSVSGRFAHVVGESPGSQDEGWFPSVEAAWTATGETDRIPLPCGDSGS